MIIRLVSPNFGTYVEERNFLPPQKFLLKYFYSIIESLIIRLAAHTWNWMIAGNHPLGGTYVELDDHLNRMCLIWPYGFDIRGTG